MNGATVVPVVRVHPKLGELRLVPVDGQTWFIAADLARALSLRSASALTRSLDDTAVKSVMVDTAGGPQQMLATSAAGLFKAICKRRSAAVDELQRWVFGDVLGQSGAVPALNWARRRTSLNPRPFELTGARLNSELNRLGLRVGVAARLAGVATCSFYNYMNGLRERGVEFFRKMDAVGMDVLFIVTGRRDPSKAEAAK